MKLLVALLLVNVVTALPCPACEDETLSCDTPRPRASPVHQLELSKGARSPTALVEAQTTAFSPADGNTCRVARRPPIPFIYPVYDATAADLVESYTITPTAAFTVALCDLDASLGPRRPPVPYGPDEYDPQSRVSYETTLVAYSMSTNDVGGDSIQARRPPIGNAIPIYEPASDEFPAGGDPAAQHRPAPPASDAVSLRGQPPPWSQVPAEAQSNWADRTVSVSDAPASASVVPDAEANAVATTSDGESDAHPGSYVSEVSAAAITATATATLDVEEDGSSSSPAPENIIPEATKSPCIFEPSSSMSPTTTPIFMTLTKIVTFTTRPVAEISRATASGSCNAESLGYGTPSPIAVSLPVTVHSQALPSTAPAYNFAPFPSSLALTAIEEELMKAIRSTFKLRSTTASTTLRSVKAHKPTAAHSFGLIGHETSAWNNKKADIVANTTTFHVFSTATATPPAYLYRGPPNVSMGGGNTTSANVLGDGPPAKNQA